MHISTSFYIFFLLLLTSGCTHYRVVLLESFIDPADPSKPKTTTYAVTKNNMIIPEYVVDRTGNYPTSKDIARERFELRREGLKELVEKKYKTENNFTYQAKRIFFGIGFTLVSPIAIPIIYFSEKISSDNSSSSREDQSVVADYFKNIGNEPLPRKPVLKNEINFL